MSVIFGGRRLLRNHNRALESIAVDRNSNGDTHRRQNNDSVPPASNGLNCMEIVMIQLS